MGEVHAIETGAEKTAAEILDGFRRGRLQLKALLVATIEAKDHKVERQIQSTI